MSGWVSIELGSNPNPLGSVLGSVPMDSLRDRQAAVCGERSSNDRDDMSYSGIEMYIW